MQHDAIQETLGPLSSAHAHLGTGIAAREFESFDWKLV